MSITLYDVVDTNFFTACINANKPVRFIKWGDGEFQICIGDQGANCDGDIYFPELGEKIRIAFLKLAFIPNTYYGCWHTSGFDGRVKRFFDSMWETLVKLPASYVPWVHYHCLLRDAERGRKPDMLNLMKAIQANQRKKIYVCNKKNSKLCRVINAEHVEVPEKCWFLHYDTVMQDIKSKITPDCIILFSAGLCTKAAIAELVETNPGITCLDFGSSFDCLTRGITSRSYQGSFQEEVAYYSEILPADWIERITEQ